MKSILLVEDHADTREFTRRVLMKRGYVVHVAQDASEARALIGAERPDLLLCDISLGGDADGCALLREFRTLYPGLKGIAVSGRVYPADEDRCRAAGFTGFVRKPVDLNLLIEAIESQLLASPGTDRSGVNAEAPPPSGQ